MRTALTALTLALLLSTAAAQTGVATVDFDDQTTDGTFVIVQQVTLSNGGFVVIHDETLNDGDALGSVVGHSEYLSVGTHNDVRVNITLNMENDLAQDDNQTDNQTMGHTVRLIAMPHFDTNDNQEYDFQSSSGQEDGPYTDGGAALTQEATITIQESQAAQPGGDDEFGDPENDTPALGVLLTVGVLGALALIRRR